MKKRICGILLLLCLMVSLLPVGALAAGQEESSVIASGSCGASATYTVTSDGVMTIKGSGTMQGVAGVTSTAPDMLQPLNKVVFEEGITAVGDSAFDGNPYIQEVVFPESLTEIGNRAFQFCNQLETVTFGQHLRVIGEYAFRLTALKGELNLPESVQTIRESAFEDTNITGAVIYGDVGFGAFRSNSELKYAVVMNSKTLGGDAFRSCSQLEEIYLADTITSIEYNAFDSCSQLKEVRIPAKVTELPDMLFFMCSSLERVIMPTVRRIGANVFMFDNALSEIYYAGTEQQLRAMEVHVDGNDQLDKVTFYLMPAMPDPIFGLFDMPDASDWSYEGIAFCLSQGFMNGMGGGYFQPGGTTTRAQLVTILWRMCEEPAAAKAADFKDTQDQWAKDAIAWAAENGIVNGIGEGLFAPNAPVTREQLVTIFHRFCRECLGMETAEKQVLSSFPDASQVSEWAAEAMQWGVAVKLISGVGTQNGPILQPQGSATRAQIAKIILNFFENVYTET